MAVNSSVGEVVVEVSASDADSGSNGEITYLLSGSEADRFRVDPITGEVTVVRPLDYETYTEPYVLTAIARDNGKPCWDASEKCCVSVRSVSEVFCLCWDVSDKCVTMCCVSGVRCQDVLGKC